MLSAATHTRLQTYAPSHEGRKDVTAWASHELARVANLFLSLSLPLSNLTLSHNPFHPPSLGPALSHNGDTADTAIHLSGHASWLTWSLKLSRGLWLAVEPEGVEKDPFSAQARCPSFFRREQRAAALGLLQSGVRYRPSLMIGSMTTSPCNSLQGRTPRPISSHAVMRSTAMPGVMIESLLYSGCWRTKLRIHVAGVRSSPRARLLISERYWWMRAKEAASQAMCSR
mmetsp:Transcript_58479/g.152022  ORF Transcript_58479/g.152022 Transcript_58479/m.152022 type:complete len:228 (-) Transcript_58479:1299-1982(-)